MYASVVYAGCKANNSERRVKGHHESHDHDPDHESHDHHVAGHKHKCSCIVDSRGRRFRGKWFVQKGLRRFNSFERVHYCIYFNLWVEDLLLAGRFWPSMVHWAFRCKGL